MCVSAILAGLGFPFTSERIMIAPNKTRLWLALASFKMLDNLDCQTFHRIPSHFQSFQHHNHHHHYHHRRAPLPPCPPLVVISYSHSHSHSQHLPSTTPHSYRYRTSRLNATITREHFFTWSYSWSKATVEGIYENFLLPSSPPPPPTKS